MNNDDTPLFPSSTDLDSTRHLPDSSTVIDSQEQAWQRLITRVVPRDEIPSLIETVLSGRKTDVAGRLRESDAQAFVDTLDEARHHTLYFRMMVDLLLLYSFFLGIERIRSRTTYPEEMHENIIQDVCSPRSVP